MSKKIRLRRNTKANIPVLQLAEPFWATDENKLYVGDGSANHEVGPKTVAELGLDADLATFSVPASTTISDFMRPALSAASSSAAWDVLGVSSFSRTMLDDADATAVKATLGISSVTTHYVFPEDYGAVGDGTTDDSVAIQACFDAVKGETYCPPIIFKARKYAFGTGLIIDFAQAMRISGTGGYWTPSDAGYGANATTLYYTGSGTALTIDGTTNNATGFIMEQLYLQGTPSATKGLYVNNAAGLVFRDMTIGKFSHANTYGLHFKASQVNSLYNIGFVGNNYGVYLEGGSNTTLRFYDCSWMANRSYDIYDTGSQFTILYNPVFQQTLGCILSIQIASGSGFGQGFTIYNWYDEASASTYDMYLIDIRGDSSAESAYYKNFSMYGGMHNGGGAEELGFMRIQYTKNTLIDGIRSNVVLPKPLYTTISSNINLRFLNWDPAFSDDFIQDGAANTMYWPKTYGAAAGGEYQYTIKSCGLDVLQTNPDGGREALNVKQDDEDVAFVNFQGTSEGGASKNISTWTNATLGGFIKVEINGSAKWIPFYAAPTS